MANLGILLKCGPFMRKNEGCMKENMRDIPLPYRSEEQKTRLKLSTMPSLSYFCKNPKLYCPKCGAGLYLRRKAKKTVEGKPEI